jgi:hypothetical protein
MLQQARVVPTFRQRALLHLNTAGHLRGGCGASDELLAASDAAAAFCFFSAEGKENRKIGS